MRLVERYALIFLALVITLQIICAVSEKLKQPTADQLYGCSPAQAAPNGECK